MKRFLAAVATTGLMAFAAPAFAQTIDGSIGYSGMDFDGLDVGAITARMAWSPTPHLGIEGEASFGIEDDTFPVMGSPPPTRPGTFELKHQVAIYGVAGVPVGESGRVFARLGYGTQKLESDLILGRLEESKDGVNYGVGAQMLLDGRNGVRVDYTKHDFDLGGADVWSISYVRRFR